MTYIDIDAPLYQWDRGREITITLTRPPVQKVHFAFKGENRALSVKPSKKNGRTVAEIPDILLQRAGKLNVYLVIGTGEDEHTAEARTLTISPKEKPDEYIYTDDEKLLWHEIDERISIVENDLANLDLDSFATKTYVGDAINELPRAYEKISLLGEMIDTTLSIDLLQLFDEPGAYTKNYYNNCGATTTIFQFGTKQITYIDLNTVAISVEYNDATQSITIGLPQGEFKFERHGDSYHLTSNTYLTTEGLDQGEYTLVRSINGETPDSKGRVVLDYTTNGIQFTEQHLSESEQMQARENMGLYYTEETDEGTVVHQIDDAYIPNTIARAVDVPPVGGYELVGSVKVTEPTNNIVMFLSKPCSHLRIAAFRQDAGFFVSRSNTNTAVNGNLTVWAHKYGEQSARGVWVQGNGTIGATVQQPLAFCDITVLPNGRVAAIGWMQRSSGGYSGTPSAMTSDWSSVAQNGKVYELYFNEGGSSNLINSGVELYVWGC